MWEYKLLLLKLAKIHHYVKCKKDKNSTNVLNLVIYIYIVINKPSGKINKIHRKSHFYYSMIFWSEKFDRIRKLCSLIQIFHNFFSHFCTIKNVLHEVEVGSLYSCKQVNCIRLMIRLLLQDLPYKSMKFSHNCQKVAICKDFLFIKCTLEYTRDGLRFSGAMMWIWFWDP